MASRVYVTVLLIRPISQKGIVYFNVIKAGYIILYKTLLELLYSSVSANVQIEIKTTQWSRDTCTYTINPPFKPWGLINFMVHNHPGSNRD